MKTRITTEELVFKRLQLTQEEYSDLMFDLEQILQLYETMKDDNPQYDSCSDRYTSELREVDFLDLGTAQLWGRELMATLKQLSRKAHSGENIIGHCKHHPNISYSKEKGLRVRYSDGKYRKAGLFELML